MKKKNLLIVGAFALLVVFFFAFSNHHQQRASEHRGGHSEHVVNVLSRWLDLSAEQKCQLTELQATLNSKEMQHAEVHTELAAAVLAQLQHDRIIPAELNRVFTEKEAHWVQTRQALVQQFADFHASLSKTQRARLRKIIAYSGHDERER